MKKTIKILLVLCTLVNCNLVFSQTPCMIKEQYDALKQRTTDIFDLFLNINEINSVTHKPQFNDEIHPPVNVDDYDYNIGDRFANVWSSYLSMFKVTGDKAYLHHFISQTFFTQQFRNDLQNSSYHPGWWQINRFIGYDIDGDPILNDAQEYWDGITICPMAEYCFKIKNDPDFIAIANSPLPSCSTLSSTMFGHHLDRPQVPSS